MAKSRKGTKPARNPTWAEITQAKRRATGRMLVQCVWALHNTTDLGPEGIHNVISYMHQQQDYFNDGSINYNDVIKALYDECGIDLREVGKIIR